MESSEFRYVYYLVQDYLKYILQEPELGPAPSRVAHVLRNSASFLQKENEEILKPCLDTLDITSVDAARRIFIQVMDKEFDDGNTNWGRILTIFMFGGILSKRLQEHKVQLTGDNKEQISYFITEYIINTKAEWIDANGGWENGFLPMFEEKQSWLSLFNIKAKIMDAFSFFSQYY
ncbi:bcl-2-related protein A1 [Pelodiscus sinensis]|uniref:Bcl-2-related protein A1 n=1 Tax=Pelodiscus sinensis TaxID=13735 RepID=K7G130_PELSI|nr:bcl-2-related protein A1 [Pelodiscus sinensis]|eukprot:XP_014437116.1 bcl-2-related protein A1 [Pelodiscus sinensis]